MRANTSEINFNTRDALVHSQNPEDNAKLNYDSARIPGRTWDRKKLMANTSRTHSLRGTDVNSRDHPALIVSLLLFVPDPLARLAAIDSCGRLVPRPLKGHLLVLGRRVLLHGRAPVLLIVAVVGVDDVVEDAVEAADAGRDGRGCHGPAVGVHEVVGLARHGLVAQPGVLQGLQRTQPGRRLHRHQLLDEVDRGLADVGPQLGRKRVVALCYL